jgi:protein SCO1/2
MNRTTIMLAQTAVAAALLSLAAPSARADDPAPAARGPASGQPAIGLDDKTGAHVPVAGALRDSTGAPAPLSRFVDGKRPIVLVLAYARCTMLCNVVLHATADAIAAGALVPGRDFTPIVVSLDPRETPDEASRRQATLLASIGHPGDRAAWPYLVGNDADIHALADAVGFHYAWDPRTEQYAHPAAIFVLTPDGRVAETLRGVQFTGLDAAIERARRGLLTPATSHDLVACFHFDPALRRHQAQIQRFFRIGATTVFVALLATIGGLLCSERRRGRRARARLGGLDTPRGTKRPGRDG